MIKKISLPLLLLFCQLTKAQDTILKFNGETIISKVIEITTTEVKYKKFNFLDGPTYIDQKSTIHFIKYQNGNVDEFPKQQEVVTQTRDAKQEEKTNNYYGDGAKVSNRIEMWGNQYQYQRHNINERDMHSILLQTKDKRLITLVGNSKSAHKIQFIGFAAIPLGIAAGVLLLYSAASVPNNSYNSSKYLTGAGICAIAAISCPIASGIYKHRRTEYNRQAIKLYNESY